MRQHRPVIAIHEVTGERKKFDSVYAVAKELGGNNGNIIARLAMGNAYKGWKMYDTPDNIRKRIAELEETIKILEG